MSDLLLAWLNDDIQLSKRITNFETDFHNGYLFGELLAKYSQQLNFPQFIDKDDKKSRIRNFQLLYDTFASLRVTFNSDIAMQVINQSYGVARKLLYELKTQLEKTNSNAFNKSTKMTKTLSPLKKIQISKEKFDNVNKQHFSKLLNEKHQAHKSTLQQNVLKKFNDFHQKSMNRAYQLEEKEKQANLLLRNKVIEQQRDNLKKSQDFHRQWEAEHAEKWALNMSIRQTQVQKDQFYKSKFETTKIQNKTMAQLSAIKALDNDIAAFQKKNIGKKDSSDQQQINNEPQLQKNTSKISQKLKKRQSQLKTSLLPTDNAHLDASPKKKALAIDQKSKHQREKRRRKMIVEQNKRYQMIEITRRQRYIINTIEQTSKQQKQIQYEIWRAWQNKKIMAQNGVLAEERQKEKQQTRAMNAKFKREQLHNTYKQQHQAEVKDTLARYNALQVSHKVANRKKTYKQCEHFVYEMISITEQIYSLQQQLNNEALPKEDLSWLLQKFVEAVQKPEDVSKMDLRNYIQGKGEWEIQIKKQGETSQNPVEDGAIPSKVVNNFFLGNTLRTIFQKYYNENKQIKAELEPNQKIVVCLLGPSFSGKREIANKLNISLSKPNDPISIIEIGQIIQNKVQSGIELLEKGVQLGHQTKELMDRCMNGKDIPDQIIISLLKQEIQPHKRCIIIDFPTTYEQAVSLTKHFAGISPSDYNTPTALTQKIAEFSRLVFPTPPKIVQIPLRSCGIDMLLWLNLPIECSIDRCIGRRAIKDAATANKSQKNTVDVQANQQIVHIKSVKAAENVGRLQIIEKGSSLILGQNFRMNSIPQVKEWFKIFGDGGSASHPTQSGYDLCWREVDKDLCIKSEQDVQNEVLKIFTGLEQHKKQKYQQYLAHKENLEKQNQHKLQQLKHQQELKLKCVHTPHSQIKQNLSHAQSLQQIQREFIVKLGQMWNTIESMTVSCANRVFTQMRQQWKAQHLYLSSVKKNYISLLTREDQKFYLIKQFQIEYNKFLSLNMDMLIHQYTKEELHQRVEDLELSLLAIAEEKKEDAAAERTSIMGSGWLENRMDGFYGCIIGLIQMELNRYFGCERILSDWYGKKYGAIINQEQAAGYEMNQEGFVQVQAWKDNASPKLDKIITEAMRVFNREEQVVEDKNKKGGKAPPAKKDDKKQAKKGGKQEAEVVAEPTKEEIQLKKAINTEKAIFRYRIHVIKLFAMSRLKQIWEAAQKLYRDLQDLYLYTNRVQIKAISNLARIFRRSIEKEMKIQNEVQMKHAEVIETQLIRNYQKQKAIILPARQMRSDNSFRITELKEIMEIIKGQAQNSKSAGQSSNQSTGRITTKRLLTLLIKLNQNLQLKSLIPLKWQTLSVKQMEGLVRLLDHAHKGYVDLAKLFIVLILSDRKLPTQPQFSQYSLDLTNYSAVKQINKARFITVNAWFDEEITHIENIRPFQRNIMIKQMLFDIFKRPGEDIMDISKFMHAIKLDQYRDIKPIQEPLEDQEQELTYFEYMFK